MSSNNYHTAEGSSRKRIKISREAGRAVDMPPTSPEIATVKSTTEAKKQPSPVVQNGLHANGQPCHHEQSLRTLHTDLDAMRQLITCKICQRFLYEPYALTCGHTFCYSCLTQWMNMAGKKTCPDCRTQIKSQPSPSYLIREMVLIFASKSELLPDGETMEDHTRFAKEEADIVAKDKADTNPKSGGLFHGVFAREGRRTLRAIIDYGDNVLRCPNCLHEVEDGMCNTCNVRVRPDNDLDGFSDQDSEELDEDLDEPDLDLEFGLNGDYTDWSDPEYDPDHPPPERAAYIGRAANRLIDLDDGPSDDEAELDYDDHDDTMDGFIAGDDEPVAYEGDSDGTGAGADTEFGEPRVRSRRRERPIVLSDDEDEGANDPPVNAARRPRGADAHYSISSDTEEAADDDDEEGPIRGSQRRSRHRPAHRQIVDDSDEESEDGAPASDHSLRGGGFSPLQSSSGSEASSSGDDDDENEHDDDDNDDGEHDDGSEGVSEVSGSTDQGRYFDNGEESDDGSDVQSTATGCDPEISMVGDEDVLTSAADTRMPSSGYRTHYNVPSPPSQPPSYSSLFPNRPIRRAAPQSRVTPIRTYRPPTAAYQPVRPAHPFNLDNTLARIHHSHQAQPEPSHPTYSRRPWANAANRSDGYGGVNLGRAATASSSGRRMNRDNRMRDEERDVRSRAMREMEGWTSMG